MPVRAPKKQFLFFRRLPPPPKGEYGGLEKLMFDWFERIDYSSNEAIVYVTTGWKDRFLKEAANRHLPLIVQETPFDYFNIGPVNRFFDMRAILKGYKPDGIVFFQAHFEEFGIPELLAAKWSAKGNVFMHENTGSLKPPEKSSKKYFGFISGIGLWWQYYMFCIRFRASIAKNILAVSQEIKNRYVNWWGYPENKVLVTYHGVDSKTFLHDPSLRATIRKELNIPENDQILIILARFTPLKRLDRAIRAFDQACRNFTNIHLVMVGSGPLESECRQLAATLPCFKNIYFLGHKNNPADYLKMADIFVLSSDNEGLCIALLEAMACGLISVSTDCTGSNEVIFEGQTGFIVSKTDASVAEGISKALNLPGADSQAMRQSAMKYIQEQFDINQNVQKVFRIMGIIN